jgi:hypothetical protein
MTEAVGRGTPAAWLCLLCAALGFAAGRSIGGGAWVTGEWAIVLIAGLLAALAYRLADRSRLWEIPALALMGLLPLLLGLNL